MSADIIGKTVTIKTPAAKAGEGTTRTMSLDQYAKHMVDQKFIDNVGADHSKVITAINAAKTA